MAADPKPRVHVEVDSRAAGAVARVTIDNATRLNILGSALMAECVGEVTALGAREDLRALVLTGAGDRAFIGGANIHEMAALDAAGARGFITGLHRMCAALRGLPVPVIARINGYALGAGLEVAAACDLRIAAANAVFGMPEVKVGIPSVIEAALLPGLIGWGRTRELLLLGENIDAETALGWGLVQRVVPADGLDAAVEACVAALLNRSSVSASSRRLA
jgi:enoyl-CoA hydratase